MQCYHHRSQATSTFFVQWWSITCRVKSRLAQDHSTITRFASMKAKRIPTTTPELSQVDPIPHCQSRIHIRVQCIEVLVLYGEPGPKATPTTIVTTPIPTEILEPILVLMTFPILRHFPVPWRSNHWTNQWNLDIWCRHTTKKHGTHLCIDNIKEQILLHRINQMPTRQLSNPDSSSLSLHNQLKRLIYR